MFSFHLHSICCLARMECTSYNGIVSIAIGPLMFDACLDKNRLIGWSAGIRPFTCPNIYIMYKYVRVGIQLVNLHGLYIDTKLSGSWPVLHVMGLLKHIGQPNIHSFGMISRPQMVNRWNPRNALVSDALAIGMLKGPLQTRMQCLHMTKLSRMKSPDWKPILGLCMSLAWAGGSDAKDPQKLGVKGLRGVRHIQ